MTDTTERNAAWRTYRIKLQNMTEREEAVVERAWMAGWYAKGATQPLAKREVEQ
jgi:hypothetical protein